MWWTSLLEPGGLLLRERHSPQLTPDNVLTALRSGRLRGSSAGSTCLGGSRQRRSYLERC
jgi:hypothetical protein